MLRPSSNHLRSIVATEARVAHSAPRSPASPYQRMLRHNMRPQPCWWELQTSHTPANSRHGQQRALRLRQALSSNERIPGLLTRGRWRRHPHARRHLSGSPVSSRQRAVAGHNRALSEPSEKTSKSIGRPACGSTRMVTMNAFTGGGYGRPSVRRKTFRAR